MARVGQSMCMRGLIDILLLYGLKGACAKVGVRGGGCSNLTEDICKRYGEAPQTNEHCPRRDMWPPLALHSVPTDQNLY